MSYKRIETAGDLMRFRCDLRVECGFCHATRTVSALGVYLAAGSTTLEAFRKRLKCSRCGRKQAQIVVLEPL